jgi:DNA-binding response OmpR family regulator/HPt (histidine-containing phosphotransfer) domain-containing protein
MRILIVEDDQLTGLTLVHSLTAQQYVVSLVTDGETGLQLAQDWEYDLVLLDVILPKLDGIAVCQRLRAQGFKNPILLLTAKDRSPDRVLGLDAGADDYVVKPFDLPELMARIRALLRRGQGAKAAVITWENVRLDPVSSQVTCDGQPLHLTPKEYCVLELFLLNPQRIFNRSTILDRLWDLADSPGEETVSSHIYSLRQKLKAAGVADFLETVYGLGYRLRAPTLAPEPPAPGLELPASVPELPAPLPELPAPLPATSQQERHWARMGKTWKKFKPKVLAQIDVLEQTAQALQTGTLGPGQQQQAEQTAHKLVSALGLFGWLAGSDVARRLEGLLQQEDALLAQQAPAVREGVRSLRQGVELVDGTPPNPVITAPEPPSLPYFPLLLIVDDDLLLAEEIRLEATLWGLQVEVATDLAVARVMLARRQPDVVLLDLNFPGAVEDGLTLLRELASRWPRLPVLVSTVRASLRDRIEVVRLGGCAFLRKPLPTQEILQAVTAVLKPSERSPVNRVLVVEPQATFGTSLEIWLRPWAVEVTQLTQPHQFWEVLLAIAPDLLIIDLDLTICGGSGIDLCQVVRHDPQWQDLPILVVTAQTDMMLMHQIFAAGATDVIQKPVLEADLVKRIISRLDGVKLPVR